METEHTETPMRSAPDLSGELLDCVPIPLLLLDVNGRIVRANPTECRLLGYPTEEMHGKPLWDFIADEEKQSSQERFQDIVNGLEMATSYRRRFKTEAGDYLICELSVKLISDGSSDGPYVLLASIDVTTQVTEACRRGEFARWMEASFRSMPEAAMIVDTLGHIRYLNYAAEQILGWSESEASGSMAENLIPWSDILSSDGTRPNYEFRLGVSQGWSGTATVVTKGDVAKRIQVRTEPLVDFNGLVLGIVSCLSPF
jgi:PAS domain S-box-containing protein